MVVVGIIYYNHIIICGLVNRRSEHKSCEAGKFNEWTFKHMF